MESEKSNQIAPPETSLDGDPTEDCVVEDTAAEGAAPEESAADGNAAAEDNAAELTTVEADTAEGTTTEGDTEVNNKTEEGRPRRKRSFWLRPHSIRRFRHLSRREQWRQIRVGLVLLVIMAAIAFAVIWKDYHERPGILERSSLKATERGTDQMTLVWKGTRNTDSYTIYYKVKGESPLGWHKVTIENEKGGMDTVTLKNLKEGTSYGIIVRADNDERTGFSTKEKFFKTRMSQHLKIKKHFTKLTCSEKFDLGVKAETPLTYKSSDEDVVKVNKKGIVSFKGSGTAKITITAKETKDYLGDETETEIEVIATDPVGAGGASAHIIYSIGPDNCEVIKTITGADGAVVPQAFGYTGEKYIVAYGMSGKQRIVSFDKEGDGKSVSVPAIALGHPNGFCYADSNKTCYCVKGWSGRAVTYKPETGEYGVVTFPYGASGIGYDREEDLIYTCSRTAMVAYSIGEDGYEIQHRCGVVRHSGHTYTQDCGGHAGIMMRCLSGSSKHGTNYIDLYDMKHGEYLGTIACDLSEVESAVADEDGYMLVLANTSDGQDYIWKTPINIGDIGAGLRDD